MVSSRPLTGLRVVGLVILVAAACGAAYYMFVTEQRHYLTQRNFRVLATVGSQFEKAANGEANIFQALAADPKGEETLKAQWRERYAGPAPQFRPIERPSTKATVVNRGGFRLDIDVTGSGTAMRVTLPMSRFIDSIMSGKTGSGSFDTLLLVTPAGEIVLGQGRRVAELGPAGLAALGLPGPDKKLVAFKDVSATAGVHEVVVSDVAYELFVAPCCFDTTKDEAGLVVAGLVEKADIDRDSRAISTMLVMAGVLLIVVVAFTWPFIRMALIGERQRLKRSDFFQVTFSSLAGLAVLTILVLDTTAYWRLNRDRDAQLRHLAGQLETAATGELGRAYRQLECLEQELAPVALARRETGDTFANALADKRYACGGKTRGTWAYPYFESVSLITDTGDQNVKLSSMSWVPSRINVSERPYFKPTLDGQLTNRTDDMCPEGCVLNSVRSWTTGTPQMVLAKPRSTTSDGEPGYALATLAVPMLSLIDPILPSGFQFAVVSDDGMVLFHSDHQRNLGENLFQETDDSRRLRAEVHGHSAEPLNVRYWGVSYRAFVQPWRGTPWSIVTLYGKDEGEALDREWLVVAFIFLGIYLLLWIGLAAITLMSGSSWVWPDSAKRRKYRAVAGVQALLIVAATVAAAVAQHGVNLKLGLLLPLIGWGAAAVILKSHAGDASRQEEEPLIEYSLATCLTLVVVSIVPGVLLFLASFQIHAKSYVKSTELEIARKLEARAHDPRISRATADKPLWASGTGPAVSYDPGLYDTFLYDLRESNTSGKIEHDASRHREDMILSALEEYLPYYSQASVRWRELFHDEAADESWTSRMDRNGRLVTTVLGDGGSRGIEISSYVPSVLSASVPTGDFSGTSSWAATVVLFIAAAGLILLTGFIARTLRRQFFLAGVVRPRWAKARFALNADDNVFIWCDDNTRLQQLAGTPPLRLGPIAKGDNPALEWCKVLIRLEQDETDLAVLVDDFDENLEDGASMERKVGFLEDLVEDKISRAVVVISQHSAHGIADSLRRSAGSESTNVSERWRTLMRTFVLLDWQPASGEPLMAGAVRETQEGGPTTESAAGNGANGKPGRRLSSIEALLQAEAESEDRYVLQVCGTVRHAASADPLMTRDQVFDELADRLAHYYRRIWNSCSDEDKIVLTHVAQDGLASWSLRRGVRRLLAKRLLLKDPELRLMNGTFRHFVLSPSCLADVDLLEGSESPSAWDHLRLPLGFVLVSVGVFLFATQKELYNAILATTTAAAVSLPTLIKAVSTLAGGRAPDAAKKDA